MKLIGILVCAVSLLFLVAGICGSGFGSIIACVIGGGGFAFGSFLVKAS